MGQSNIRVGKSNITVGQANAAVGKSNIRVGGTCERAGDDQQGLRELGHGQLLAQDKDKGKDRKKEVDKVTNK